MGLPVACCRLGRELCAGGDAELGEDVGQVGLDGAGGHEQSLGDLPIGESGPDQIGDLVLGGREARPSVGGSLAGAPTPRRVSDRCANVERGAGAVLDGKAL